MEAFLDYFPIFNIEKAMPNTAPSILMIGRKIVKNDVNMRLK